MIIKLIPSPAKINNRHSPSTLWLVVVVMRNSQFHFEAQAVCGCVGIATLYVKVIEFLNITIIE